MDYIFSDSLFNCKIELHICICVNFIYFNKNNQEEIKIVCFVFYVHMCILLFYCM